ncbi:MDR family MFS transporter [Tenggerimyces flavus]|uniref:MDR family MFS transporter n=1 Tax=Tenggerimyces flavus TaxID=1708749 RepID=A0ABV7YIM1_9ACTN|nr:MDR family MFS transporter [Tenggerimyces flavus]MBM7784278.1 EmrB/QacA subfamily drug resistance transporter [Tenggerimyces flavus]
MTDGSARQTTGPSPTRRGRVVTALMLTMALAAMDTTIVATALPQVVGDLGGLAYFSWLFSVYLLAQTVTIPIYGKLADTYGRKRVLIVGVLIFLLGSGLSALSWDMVALIAFRGIQGIGAGSIGAVVTTIVADLYNLSERGKVQGRMASVWGISAVVGPTMGGAFADYASWRWVFLVNLPVGAAALALIVRYLHEKVPERTRHRVDYLGAALVMTTAGLFVFALLQGGTAWPWLSAPSFIVFGCFALAAAATVIVERRAAEPIVPGWVWSRRTLLGGNLTMACLGLLVIGPSAYLPTYGQGVLGLSAIVAGLVLATMSMTWPIAASQANKLYLRIGFRDTSLIGVALCLVAIAIFLLQPATPSVWPVVASTLVLGAGCGLLSVPTLVGIQSHVEWNERGVATSSIMFNRFLGQSIGAAVFGAIANATLVRALADAPAGLRGELPKDLNGISEVLDGANGPAMTYLRTAIEAATHNVYLGLTVAALLGVVVLLFVMPRKITVVSHDNSQ